PGAIAGGPGAIAGGPGVDSARPSPDLPRDPVAAALASPVMLPGAGSDRAPASPTVGAFGPEAQGPVADGPTGRPLPEPHNGTPPADRQGGCTTAQLRRFIKSRAYVPMHEIRRRFLIATEDDDVARIDLGGGRIFVGLPAREGQMLGELLRGGEIGYELQLDPVAPVVVGVYPMRPVTRG
ncbi:MAG: hypothetical protein QOF11_353, partial [Chloroflexota bacterium]|nr:hypothetical protein [Chloroflexota bacterium]